MPNAPADEPASWPGPGATTHTLSDDDAGDGEQRIRAALSAAGTAAWQSDLATRERWWSREMFAMHGLATNADAPADYMDVVHPDDRQQVAAAFAASLHTGAHQVRYRVRWPDGSVHWIEGIGRTQRDAAGRPRSITGICTLIDARKREESDLRFLAAAATEFARSTDYEDTLRRVAAMAVPQFADWCAVDMLDDGELRRLAVAHVDPEKISLAEDVQRRYPPEREPPSGTWRVVQSGDAELLSNISDEMLVEGARDEEHLATLRSLGLRSYMAVPIIGIDGVVGVISFVSAESGRVYEARDLDLARDLVSRASVAIQNARLVRAQQRSQQRQAFLLALTDVLRARGTMQEILQRVAEMLGRSFVVDRVGYGHVDEQHDVVEYDVCWAAGVPPLLGRFPASAFGPQVIERLRAGDTVAIANVREHALTSEAQTIRTSHEVDTRAILVVPLFTAGQLRTIVYLNQRLARQWTADEISLMEEVAERTRELIERGRTEAALRKSEAQWRGLFERMTEGFFVGEAIRDDAGRMRDFRFVELNPAFERLTGLPIAAALGRPVTEVIPGIQGELIERYERVVDSGEPTEFEVLVPALNDRWYEARARRVAAERFSVLFLEITERKVAQRELERTAERYRTLFDSIDEGFCILEVLFDAEGRATDYRFDEVNPAFERQSGLTNAAGRRIRELVPDIEQSYVDTYARVQRAGESLRFESHAAALQRWFDAFAFRIGDPARPRVALLFTDITERKRAERALQEREFELREAHRLAGTGAWYWHAGEDRTDASPELMEILGLPRDATLPPFAAQRGTLYDADDWHRLDEAVRRALASGEPFAVDLRAHSRGRPIWVTSRGSVVRASDDRIVGLRGTLQDITERKQIEEALRAADVRKDEFLATLAHELRNPLAPLRSGLAILRKSAPASAPALRAQELMERQLVHLVRLVDDLLDVSRVTQGQVALKKVRTTLRDVVDLALETSRPWIDAAGHSLALQLPAATVALDVDPTRIAQVLANVLNNAAKYTPDGGHLALRAAVDDERGRVRIEVQDDGLGIPSDMVDEVFDLFTQLRNTREHAQGGLGIGLSLSRRLVELHGGTIEARSDGPGCGTTLVVELPIARGDAAAAAEPRAAPDAGAAPRARRIIVVDDNVDAAQALSELLELDGHDVDVVHSGQDALAAARRQPPDAMVLDIGLPDLDGYEVAVRVRADATLRDTRLIAVTGWGTERDQQRSRAAGIDVHLTKPVTPEDLARALA